MRTHNPFLLIAACALLSLPVALLAQVPPTPSPTSNGLVQTRSVNPTDHGTPIPMTVDAPVRVSAPATAPPRFAYYYIWFTRSSWRRAKTDLPLLGPYDSSDANVMRQHIVWAKAAGIDGFIVSWKHTPVLDERLATLVDVAEEEHFSLAIIYQGLDFHRNPLPAAQIGAGLAWFDQHLAARTPFRSSGKPLVIWSGTWKFSHDQIASVTSSLRTNLRILGSAKNPKDYLRIADAVDGNAYYWSSVNPDSNTGYGTKLQSMAAAVHAHDGTWIAPVAIGFDARVLGGKTVVDRQDGATYRTELAAAESSSPDFLGLISWNEFSENSYIEPSKRYGTCALGYVAQSAGLPTPEPKGCSSAQAAGRIGAINTQGATSAKPALTKSNSSGVDSSSSGSGPAYGPYVAGGFMIFLIAAVAATVRRRKKLRPGVDRLSDWPMR